MSVGYQTDSASTTSLPSYLVVQVALAELRRKELNVENEDPAGWTNLHVDYATTKLPTMAAEFQSGISSALKNDNWYFVQNYTFAVDYNVGSFATFNSSAIELTIPSQNSSSQPAAVAAPARAVRVNTASETAKIARATLAFAVERWLLKAATGNIRKAGEAAIAGDLRLAYRNVYRGLDELFRRGKWDIVSTQLAEICKDTYPATFGIGAMRFSSDASKFIPNWNSLLKTLAANASRQGMDTKRAMRGLLNHDGAA